MPQAGKIKRPGRQDRLITALDVGTTKVCCFVARVDSHGKIHVLGMGHRVSAGVKAGAVVDLEETENSIRAAVAQAEKVAGETIDDVIINFAGGGVRSHVVEKNIRINGNGVGEGELEKLLGEAGAGITLGERLLVHAFPACYSIDQSVGIRDPLGMYGEQLSVALHVVDVVPGPMRNLQTCVARAHLNPIQTVISPYAAGLASLVEDEMELGAACVDLGGGTTSVSVFARNAMVYADVLPLGGESITAAIASELLTPIHAAERLKTLYGSAIATRSDEQQTISVPILGESDQDEELQNEIPRAELTTIIQPRIETILENVGRKLVESGFDRVSGRRVVLTGGGSQLPGVRELAQKILGKQVRLGRPAGLEGLAETARGPAFSTCAGLLVYALKAPLELGEYQASQLGTKPAAGVFGKLGDWFAKNL
jgi:cell division protein FtsA